MWAIFSQFLLLGCISFGGPAAHIGYFRATFVERLKWLNENEYANLVALSQLLPGPGSSQVGFAIGYQRGGLFGGALAFIGFTLPSFLMVFLFASSATLFTDYEMYPIIIASLKLLAVVVVFDALLSMYTSFCKTKLSIFICLFSACILLVWPSVSSQIIVLIIAALFGRFMHKEAPAIEGNNDEKELGLFAQKSFWFFAFLFIACLFILPIIANNFAELNLFVDFFQAGSLVFGGGHVVLPLLQNIVGSDLSSEQFLTGYALAQAVPGPMFTFATYLGYMLLPEMPYVGASIATIATFLPGFLLLLLAIKHWQFIVSKPALINSLAAVNAAVVGLLMSALYQPVFSSAVESGIDMALVLIGFYLLKQLKLSVVKLIVFFIFSALLRFFFFI